MALVFWATMAVLVLVVASLVSGVISMAHGSAYNRQHATQFMFLRDG